MQKTELTFEERLVVAYLHFVREITQQDLAVAFNVNSGRISEACTALGMAATDPKGVRKVVVADAAGASVAGVLKTG